MPSWRHLTECCEEEESLHATCLTLEGGRAAEQLVGSTDLMERRQRDSVASGASNGVILGSASGVTS
jgi:hypothetical protein